ncbi:MAG: hypothetical protein HUU02_06255 [Bacteroidetes bacterium]|nr:hypothetical protein [Bacteroidota bacterium]
MLIGIIILLTVDCSLSDEIKFRNGQRLLNCQVIDTVGAKIKVKTSEDDRYYPLTTIDEIQKSIFDTTKATIIEEINGDRLPIWLFKESRK